MPPETRDDASSLRRFSGRRRIRSRRDVAETVDEAVHSAWFLIEPEDPVCRV